MAGINTSGYKLDVYPQSPTVDTRLFINDSPERLTQNLFGGAEKITDIASKVHQGIIQNAQLKLQTDLQPYKIKEAAANTALLQTQAGLAPLQAELTRMQLENQKNILQTQKDYFAKQKQEQQKNQEYQDLHSQLGGLDSLDFGDAQPVNAAPIQENTAISPSAINNVPIAPASTGPKPLANIEVAPAPVTPLPVITPSSAETAQVPSLQTQPVTQPSAAQALQDPNALVQAAQATNINDVVGSLVASTGSGFIPVSANVAPTQTTPSTTAPEWVTRNNKAVQTLLQIGSKLGVNPNSYKTPQAYAQVIKAQGAALLQAHQAQTTGGAVVPLYNSQQGPVYANTQDATRAYPNSELSFEPMPGGGVVVKSIKQLGSAPGTGAQANQYDIQLPLNVADSKGVPATIPNPFHGLQGSLIENKANQISKEADKSVTDALKSEEEARASLQGVQKMKALLDNGLSTGPLVGSATGQTLRKIFGDSTALQSFQEGIPSFTRSARAPGERIGAFDLPNLLQASPSLDKSVQANNNILESKRLQDERSIQYSQALQNYNLTAGHTQGFDQAWQRYVDANPIFDPVQPVGEDSEYKVNPNLQTFQQYIQQENAIGIPQAKQNLEEYKKNIEQQKAALKSGETETRDSKFLTYRNKVIDVNPTVSTPNLPVNNATQNSTINSTQNLPTINSAEDRARLQPGQQYLYNGQIYTRQ